VNRDHFGGYMEMLVMIPAGLIVSRAVPKDQRALLGFAAVLMGLSIFASLSRGAILSFIAGLAFILAAGPRARPHGRESHSAGFARALLVKGGAVMTITGAIGISLLWIGAGPIVNRAADSLEQIRSVDSPSSYPSRKGIWTDTLAMIRANPVFGVGAGAYRTVFPIYSHYDDSFIVAQSPNDYLQVLADCGIVGAALLVWFIGGIWLAITGALAHAGSNVSRGSPHRSSAESEIEHTARYQRGMALGGGAAVFAMLVHSLFDFNLQLPSNALLFLVIAGAVAGLTPGRKAAEERKEGLASG